MRSIKEKSNVAIKVMRLILLSFVIVQSSFGISAQAASKVNVGTTFKVDGEKYKVTSLSPRTVELTGVYGTDWEGMWSPDDDLDEVYTWIYIGGEIKYKGNKYKVTSIADNAMKKNKVIEVITIGKEVKTIGNSAFEGCPNLIEVEIGKNVTSIGSKAFYSCKKLNTINIKSKKLKYVGSSAFKKIKKGGYIKCPKKCKKLLKGKVGN